MQRKISEATKSWPVSRIMLVLPGEARGLLLSFPAIPGGSRRAGCCSERDPRDRRTCEPFEPREERQRRGPSGLAPGPTGTQARPAFDVCERRTVVFQPFAVASRVSGEGACRTCHYFGTAGVCRAVSTDLRRRNERCWSEICVVEAE